MQILNPAHLNPRNYSRDFLDAAEAARKELGKVVPIYLLRARVVVGHYEQTLYAHGADPGEAMGALGRAMVAAGAGFGYVVVEGYHMKGGGR